MSTKNDVSEAIGTIRAATIEDGWHTLSDFGGTPVGYDLLVENGRCVRLATIAGDARDRDMVMAIVRGFAKQLGQTLDLAAIKGRWDAGKWSSAAGEDDVTLNLT